VLVAKVAAQKISGKQELEIDLDFQDVKKEDAGRDRDAPALATIFAQSSPQRKETQSPRPAISGSMAYLIRVLPGGTPEEEFQLKESGVTSIGRKFCDIVIPDDDQLSDRHASLSHEREQFLLRDDGSETGVFLRLSESSPREVGDGDLLRIGRQYLLFRVKEGDLSFTQFNQRGERVDRFPLPGRTVVVGREAPDITLDPADMALSRRHMSIVFKGGSVLVRDLKSLNGTFLKVRDAVRIDPGSQFRMGRQTFMLALQQEPQAQKIRVSTRISSPAPAQKTPAAPSVAPAKGLSATFRGAGGPFPFVQGQTVCDIAEKNGIRIVAECHAGICGSDPIRIHMGEKNLNPLSADEKGTLEDICGLQPGECRLACMVRPTGPVEVEIIGS
jgi:pSer/pThr/pTyr-binding forkhead associated (FHA) protein/ferredoxin